MANIPPLPPGFQLDAPTGAPHGAAPPLPEGFTLDQPQGATPEQENTWGNAIKNVAEAGAQTATGITGGIAGDIAGLGAMAYDATANAVMHPFSPGEPGKYADPAKVRDSVSDALTYKADNQNSLTNKVLQYPGKVMTGAGAYLGEKADAIDNSGTLGNFARAIPLALASYGGVKAARVPTARYKTPTGPVEVNLENFKPPPVAPTADQDLIKRATDAGYRLSPTQTGNKVSGVIERAAGRAESERLISKKNVPVTDNLAKKQMGIPESEELTQASFDRLRATHGKAYEKMGATGKRATSDEYRQAVEGVADRTGANSFAVDTPKVVEDLRDKYAGIRQFDAKDAVAQVKKLRADSRKAMKSDNPDTVAEGYARRKIADAIDDELERHATAVGKPELAKNYRDARAKLAQLNTYEDAFEGNHISANALAKQLDRDVPLSGNARLIAEVAGRYGRAVQSMEKIRSVGPFSRADVLLGALGAAGGHFINPYMATAIVASPAARSAISSRFFQNSFIKPKGRAAAAAASKAAPREVGASQAQRNEPVRLGAIGGR